MVRPCSGTRWLMLPPRVIPLILTDPVSPNPVASPWAAHGGGVLAGGQPRSPRRCAVGDRCPASALSERVEHDAPVGDAVPGGAVAAAADCEFQPGLLASEMTREVGGVGGADDNRRPTVDVAQEDGAGPVVAGVVGGDHPTVEGGPQPRDRDAGRVASPGRIVSCICGSSPFVDIVAALGRAPFTRRSRQASRSCALPRESLPRMANVWWCRGARPEARLSRRLRPIGERRLTGALGTQGGPTLKFLLAIYGNEEMWGRCPRRSSTR